MGFKRFTGFKFRRFEESRPGLRSRSPGPLSRWKREKGSRAKPTQEGRTPSKPGEELFR
jgi:hypothetical protein